MFLITTSLKMHLPFVVLMCSVATITAKNGVAEDLRLMELLFRATKLKNVSSGVDGERIRTTPSL